MDQAVRNALAQLARRDLNDEDVAVLDAFFTPTGRDDAQIAARLSTGRRSAPQSVSSAVVRGVLYGLGKWPGIVSKANAAHANADTSAVALACQTLYDLSIASSQIPMDNPLIAQQVAADLQLMVGANLLAAQDVVIVMALATPAEPVTPEQVTELLNALEQEG